MGKTGNTGADVGVVDPGVEEVGVGNDEVDEDVGIEIEIGEPGKGFTGIEVEGGVEGEGEGVTSSSRRRDDNTEREERRRSAIGCFHLGD